MFKLSYFTNWRNFRRETFANTRFWEILSIAWISFPEIRIRKSIARKSFSKVQNLLSRALTFCSKFTNIILKYRFFKPEVNKQDEAQINS